MSEVSDILGDEMPVRTGTPAKPWGHSWVDDTELVEKLLLLLRAGNPIMTAVGALSIPRQNFYDAMKIGRNNPDHPRYGPFAREVEAAMAAPNARWLQTINRSARTDWKAALALLERRDPENFGVKKDATTGPAQSVVIELRFPGQPATANTIDAEDIVDGEIVEPEGRELGSGADT